MSETHPSRNGRRSNVLLVLALAASVACLVYALWHFDARQFAIEVRSMDWRWVGVAFVTDILVYVIQGVRWSLLLKPVKPIPVRQSVQAIYVGLFANEILPFRSGEILRCYLQGRWSHLPFGLILSSAGIERLFDGIWLIVLLFVSLQLFQLPANIIAAGYTLAGLLVLGVAVLAVAMVLRRREGEAFQQRRWLRKLGEVLDALDTIGHSRHLYLSFLVSLPHLLMQIAPIYALMEGYGLELPRGAATVVMVVLRFGSIVPGLPGNLGTFQLSTMAALGVFAVDPAMATRFSFVMWVAITLPLLLAGFVALMVTGVRLRQLRAEAESNLQPVK